MYPKSSQSIARIDRNYHYVAERPAKPAHFYAVDKRAVIARKGDILPSAVDNQLQYRPREGHGKRHITGGAGDTGGTLRSSSREA
jgi:hypothetical protein